MNINDIVSVGQFIENYLLARNLYRISNSFRLMYIIYTYTYTYVSLQKVWRKNDKIFAFKVFLLALHFSGESLCLKPFNSSNFETTSKRECKLKCKTTAKLIRIYSEVQFYHVEIGKTNLIPNWKLFCTET